MGDFNCEIQPKKPESIRKKLSASHSFVVGTDFNLLCYCCYLVFIMTVSVLQQGAGPVVAVIHSSWALLLCSTPAPWHWSPSHNSLIYSLWVCAICSVRCTCQVFCICLHVYGCAKLVSCLQQNNISLQYKYILLCREWKWQTQFHSTG